MSKKKYKVAVVGGAGHIGLPLSCFISSHNNDVLIVDKDDGNLNKIANFKENGALQQIIYESLKKYIYLFENKKVLMKNPGLGNLNIINRAFESCYLGARSTDVYFLNIINENDVNYSRYI